MAKRGELGEEVEACALPTVLGLLHHHRRIWLPRVPMAFPCRWPPPDSRRGPPPPLWLDLAEGRARSLSCRLRRAAAPSGHRPAASIGQTPTGSPPAGFGEGEGATAAAAGHEREGRETERRE
uniref:Uncharacterized protein n=1 Tax=Oryza sativa subsp. japonica TaxID=39947 RepID=Q6Z6U2_ORYSJ|nr:hypothetical protein [Oryza sativa Japonica Group]